MKRILILSCSFLLLTGCSKTIEKIQENKIIDIMVDGQWVITHFTIDGTNTTLDFEGYSFQYQRNKTVDAIKNNTVERTGNWDGDVSTRTVWADFPGAVAPLAHLHGTWHIDNNTLTYVLLSQNAGGQAKTMRLDKL